MSSSPAAVPAADAAIWRAELARHAPFVRMTPAGIDAFIAAAQVVDYGAGEHVLGPQDGPVQALLFIRSGAIIGRRDTGPGGYFASNRTSYARNCAWISSRERPASSLRHTGSVALRFG